MHPTASRYRCGRDAKEHRIRASCQITHTHTIAGLSVQGVASNKDRGANKGHCQNSRNRRCFRQGNDEDAWHQPMHRMSQVGYGKHATYGELTTTTTQDHMTEDGVRRKQGG